MATTVPKWKNELKADLLRTIINKKNEITMDIIRLTREIAEIQATITEKREQREKFEATLVEIMKREKQIKEMSESESENESDAEDDNDSESDTTTNSETPDLIENYEYKDEDHIEVRYKDSESETSEDQDSQRGNVQHNDFPENEEQIKADNDNSGSEILEDQNKIQDQENKFERTEMINFSKPQYCAIKEKQIFYEKMKWRLDRQKRMQEDEAEINKQNQEWSEQREKNNREIEELIEAMKREGSLTVANPQNYQTI